MEKLTCQNCGAPLKRNGECPYCGTIYQISRQFDNTPIYVKQYDAKVETLRCRSEIPMEAFMQFEGSEENFRDMALHEMKHQMADALLGFMKVAVEQDPFRQVMIINGTVRVVPPGFMF